MNMSIAKDLYCAQQALFTLFSAANKLQIEGDRQLGDLTIRQMLAIPALYHAPEGMATINHIARSLGTTKQNAKQIIDAMARKGYVSVAPSGVDRRAVNVAITPDGEAAFQACSHRTDEFLAAIFSDFTSGELASLCALLQKLYRFDGAAQQQFEHGHKIDADAETAILHHHPRFAELRAKGRE